MVKLYSYVVREDSGFAPNPFYGFSTLAACKPVIRRVAQVGDWIMGTGSKQKGRDGYSVFVMCVSETMTLQEYWEDPRFRRKRPDMTSSNKKKTLGDNIYYKDPDTQLYCQIPSRHSCSDGTPDRDRLCHDTSVDRVLISDDYIYWGGEGPLVPEFRAFNVCHVTQSHRSIFPYEVVQDFIIWISDFNERGYRGKPLDF